MRVYHVRLLLLSPAMIQLKGVSRAYADGERVIQALSGITLTIPRGQTVAVVGMSGSGKSTLLHLIGGLERLSSGSITIAGAELHRMSETARTAFRLRTIGFVFQFFHLLPALTVLENLMLPAEFAGRRRAWARERALSLLEQVGLAARTASFPERLSGGEQQRVAIARALMLEPPVLLADEPTGNLDSATGARILGMIWDLTRSHNLTAVLATHSDLAAAQAERRIELHDGRIISDALQVGRVAPQAGRSGDG
jgi:putative ABC transport system ATP-binding protein